MLLGVVTRPSSESHGVQGVAGSNPAVPTREESALQRVPLSGFFFARTHVVSFVGQRHKALDAELVRTIHGFDALLVLTGSTASANL